MEIVLWLCETLTVALFIDFWGKLFESFSLEGLHLIVITFFLSLGQNEQNPPPS